MKGITTNVYAVNTERVPFPRGTVGWKPADSETDQGALSSPPADSSSGKTFPREPKTRQGLTQ